MRLQSWSRTSGSSISPFAIKIHHVQAHVTSFSVASPQHDSLGKMPLNPSTELNHDIARRQCDAIGGTLTCMHDWLWLGN
jgi:hypothetical protein